MTTEEKLALVGAVVRIRTWDSLAEEYGVNGSGDIFVDGINMRSGTMANELCGKRVVVEEISPYGHFVVRGLRYAVSEPMLDFNYSNETEEIDVASKGELDSFLNEGYFYREE